MQRPTLFMSYAHVDKHTLVVPLVETLRDGGYDPWFDHSLIPGKPWKKQLLEAIERCDAFVYAMTPESLASEWCLWELKQAVDLGKPIIPIRLQSNTILPDWLSQLQWVDFTEGSTLQAVAKLLHGLRIATSVTPETLPATPEDPTGQPASANSQIGDDTNQESSIASSDESPRTILGEARFRIGPTTISFYPYFDATTPIRNIDLGVPVDYVSRALWAGDTIELILSSTSKPDQLPSMYYLFFENYSLKFPLTKQTELDGGSKAQWLFEMDITVVGEEKIKDMLASLIGKHNKEILRIRKKYFQNE